jgi:outer membrane translocation and assembly module TamA
MVSGIAVSMIDPTDLLNKFRKLKREEQKPLQKSLDRVEHTLTHITAVLKTLPTKQDVEVAIEAAKNELKADIHTVDENILNLDAKVSCKLQRHERRITNIEEHEGIANPDKN